jgi:hypothetical protein
MSGSTEIESPAIATSFETISLQPAAMGLLIVVCSFVHRERTTRLQRTPILVRCRIRTKAFREKQKDGVVRYLCLELVSSEKESKGYSLSGHTMVKFDPRVHAMCRNERFGRNFQELKLPGFEEHKLDFRHSG